MNTKRTTLVLTALLNDPRKDASLHLIPKLALLISASIGSLAATNSHAQNLLTNGSFESGAFAGDPAAGFMSLPVGSTVIDGWGTSQAELVWGTTPNSASITASDGSRFLDLTGNHDSAPYGIIDQPFAATAGHRYKVSFDMGTQEDDPALRGPIVIAVTLRHFSTAHYTPDVSAFNFNPTGSGTQWAARSFNFTAPDDFMDVSFEGTVSTGGRYIGLDNVSVTPVSILAARTVDIRYPSIPHGHGHFVSFGAPALSDTRVVTYGTGPDGQFGIYTYPAGATAPQGMINVSDGSTPIPGGVGNFTALAPVGLQPAPAVSGENISLFGIGSSGQQGIYGLIGGSLMRVADTQTAIPGGAGLFTSFYPGEPTASPTPAISGNNIAFFGMGAGGQQGIYAMLGGALTKFADRNTTIPGGVGTFTAYSSGPIIRGEKVAFIGSGPNFQQGIYTAIRSDPAAPIGPTRVVDTNTPIPGGTGEFSKFANIAFPDEPIRNGQPLKIAFVGQGFEGQRGVYVAEQSSDPAAAPNSIIVADTKTLIPGGIGTFTDFGAVSVNATDVAFLGIGSANQTGIFDEVGGVLTDVVDVGDMLDGKLITGLAFGGGGLYGDPIAFQATFDDGSQGIYTVGVPESTSCTALMTGATILLVTARHRGTLMSAL